jgi:nifR3 family TIM-barrel protein/four helix bundle protein
VNEQQFKDRTKQVALRIIHLVEALPKTKTAQTIGGQLLRCGTSVGANYRAACRGKSPADVIAKLGIVEEEADESIYWLDLLVEAKILPEPRLRPLMDELAEIVCMTVASIKTLRARNPKSKIQDPKSKMTLLRPLRIGPVIIDPPVLQAPMAGFTNYAYRQIVRQFGGLGLPATEMVSARGFLEADARRAVEPDRLWGVREEPRPLAVQIWDNDLDELVAVGRRLVEEFRVSVVDINFGCPAKVITANKSGSYLLRDPERVGAIVGRVAAACRPTPVTAKIRLGCTRDTINAIDVAQAVEGAGGAAITVHGRTAQDMFRGVADWERIAQIKGHLQRIALIGNGDLTSAAGVVEAFRRYGPDGVMIGRAALNRPWLFREIRAALAGEPTPPEPSLFQQRQLLLDHYRMLTERFGLEKGTILMRKYACCYAAGRRGARTFRSRIAQVGSPAEFAEIVQQHFPREPADSTGTEESA